MTQGLMRNRRTVRFYFTTMKILVSLLLIIITIEGCKQKTEDDTIKTAALRYAGVFINENIHGGNNLRIKGKLDVEKNETDSTFLIKGYVEGFSPMNYPVTIHRFSETLWYAGSDPDKRESWKCIEIHIDDKK
ncbi:MAG: hypothetical protein ABI402_21455 [Ferruginibacter sp.]